MSCMREYPFQFLSAHMHAASMKVDSQNPRSDNPGIANSVIRSKDQVDQTAKNSVTPRQKVTVDVLATLRTLLVAFGKDAQCRYRDN
jgi:hypothetical protein